MTSAKFFHSHLYDDAVDHRSNVSNDSYFTPATVQRFKRIESNVQSLLVKRAESFINKECNRAVSARYASRLYAEHEPLLDRSRIY